MNTVSHLGGCLEGVSPSNLKTTESVGNWIAVFDTVNGDIILGSTYSNRKTAIAIVSFDEAGSLVVDQRFNKSVYVPKYAKGLALMLLERCHGMEEGEPR